MEEITYRVMLLIGDKAKIEYIKVFKSPKGWTYECSDSNRHMELHDNSRDALGDAIHYLDGHVITIIME